MATKYLPGWTKPAHGSYCDHYATTADGQKCERCGATRLPTTPETTESPAVRRYGEVQYERAERAEAQVRALEEQIFDLENTQVAHRKKLGELLAWVRTADKHRTVDLTNATRRIFGAAYINNLILESRRP